MGYLGVCLGFLGGSVPVWVIIWKMNVAHVIMILVMTAYRIVLVNGVAVHLMRLIIKIQMMMVWVLVIVMYFVMRLFHLAGLQTMMI